MGNSPNLGLSSYSVQEGYRRCEVNAPEILEGCQSLGKQMNQKPSGGGRPARGNPSLGTEAAEPGKSGQERPAVVEVETFCVVRWINGQATASV